MQGLFWGLHSRFHPNEVANGLLEEDIEINEEGDGASGADIDAFAEIQKFGVIANGVQKGGEILSKSRVVLKGKFSGFFFEEEVERVDDCHVGDEIDANLQFRGWFREDDSGEVVSEGVLLPVDEVWFGLNPE